MTKENMANVTRIKAKDHPKPEEKSSDEIERKVQVESKPTKQEDKNSKKVARKNAKAEKKAAKKAAKAGKKVFILFRPFCAIGRYFRDSWKEIRQVRWPSRKATWKMVLAIFVYSAVFVIILTLLDAAFTKIFDLIFN